MKAWALAAVLCMACIGESVAQERMLEAPLLFSSSDDVERVWSSVEFDTLWMFGGPSDTLLSSPVWPRLDGAQGLFFFDVRNQAAYRLGKDGELLWSWGTRGEGPAELRNVRAIDVGADRSVVLVDSGNRRVVRLSADGRFLEETLAPVSVIGTVQSVAALQGGRLAVAGRVGGSVLALWDGGNVVVAELPVSLGEAHPMQHQGRLVRWGETGWVFGFRVGNGWATFQDAALLGIYPYVEHSDFPRLRQVRRGSQVRTRVMTRPTETGQSLSVVGDTLFVLFGGTARGRVLDKFDLWSGAYLETEVLPHFAYEAVVGKDRVFTIEGGGVYPRVVALARRASSVGQGGA